MKFFFFWGCLCISINAFGQKATLRQSHYLKFEVEVSDSLLNKLDDRQPQNRKEKERLAANRNHLFQSMRQGIRDSMANAWQQKGILLNDNDTLSKYIKLGVDGFPLLALSPKGPIKKLKKKGYETDLYLSLESKIDLPGFSVLSKGIKPEVKISLTVWDQEGKLVQRITHKEKAKQAMLDKIERDHPSIKNLNTEAAGFSPKFVKFDKTQKPFVDMLIGELNPLLSLAIGNAFSKWE